MKTYGEVAGGSGFSKVSPATVSSTEIGMSEKQNCQRNKSPGLGIG